MSFPVSLSPSPVHEAFAVIPSDPLNKFDLSESEKSLLRAGEDNPLDYTLSEQKDAENYSNLLLKVLDQCVSLSTSKHSEVSRLSLDEPPLQIDDARRILYADQFGVISHYVISKLTDAIISLKQRPKSAKTTITTTFYPNGILLERWYPLLRILERGGSDIYIQRGAAFCLASILLEGCTLQSKNLLISSISTILEKFVSWIGSKLQSSSHKCLTIVTPSLTILIMSQEARMLFSETGGIGYISRNLRPEGHQNTTASIDDPIGIDNLNDRFADTTLSIANFSRGKREKHGATVQQRYELTYCLWVMSFDCDFYEKIRHNFNRDGAVAALVDVITAAPREKVVRLALSTLKNLAVVNEEHVLQVQQSKSLTGSAVTSTARRNVTARDFLHDMIGCGLMKAIMLMKERCWKDPEILDDLHVLSSLLGDMFNHMTTWDVYISEVESGHLRWGVVHSTKFFQQNAKNFEGSDGRFGLVKKLIMLVESPDDEVAAVACYNLGEFIRYYPQGKAVAKRLGAREIVMKLISHDNEDVQHQAVICLSKMLVSNWEYIK